MAATHTSELRTPTSQLMSLAPEALVRNTWNVAPLVAPAARLSGCAAMGSTAALQLLAWGGHRSRGVLRVFGIEVGGSLCQVRMGLEISTALPMLAIKHHFAGNIAHDQR